MTTREAVPEKTLNKITGFWAALKRGTLGGVNYHPMMQQYTNIQWHIKTGHCSATLSIFEVQIRILPQFGADLVQQLQTHIEDLG